MVVAAAGGGDPLGVRDDRAGRRIERCHQHRELDRPRRRRVRHQRPQVVHDERHPSALRDHHLHGQVRSGQRRPPPPAVDDPGPEGHAGRRRDPAAPRVQLLRDARPGLRGPVHRRPGAGHQHAAGRGARVRDRPGPSRPGPHPPLHAADRAGRTGARDDVPTHAAPGDVRAARRRTGRDPRAHRRGAHRHRADPAADAEDRALDGHGRQQGSAARDRDDQDRRAEHGVQGRRLGDPGLRRRRARTTTTGWRRCTRRRACSGSPTVRTRSTATSSAKLELRRHAGKGPIEPHSRYAPTWDPA